MRWLAVPCVVLLACSSSSGGGGPTGGGDGGSGPTCVRGQLVIDGSTVPAPHGSYALSSVVLTGGDFSANLPAGGGIELSWTGDATAGPVTVAGKMYIPSDEEGPPVPWCIYPPSTLRVSGPTGQLDLHLLPATNDLCDGALGPAERASACFDLAS